MSFAWFVAQRYFRTRKKTSAVGIITAVATFGVAVSVFAMFVVLSVFSGLRTFNTDFLNAFDADLTVRPAKGKVLSADSAWVSRIVSTEGVEAVSAVLEEKVFVSFAGQESIAVLKGVDRAYPEVIGVDSVLVAGGWLPFQERSDTAWHVVGISMAYRLGMGAAQEPTPLRVYVLSGGGNLSLVPENSFSRADTWTAGVFSHKDYDGTYLFVDLDFARHLLHRSAEQASGVEVRLKEGADAGKVAEALARELGSDYRVRTAIQNKEAYYKIMNTENLVLYFVFTLVIAIALFNVVGSVVMLILDKRENIRTMWALGADRAMLRGIFVREGMWIVAVGAVVGLALAVLLVWLQARYHLVMIEGSMQVPYPVRLTVVNGAIVLATIALLGYLAARLSVAGMKNVFKR